MAWTAVWTQITAGADSNAVAGPGNDAGRPAGRVWQPACFDLMRNKMIVFGGGIAGGCDVGYINDLWTYSYSANVWDQILTTKRSYEGADNITWPMGRDNHQITYDSVADLYWMYGGTCSAGVWGGTPEIWSFNPNTNTWTSYGAGIPDTTERMDFVFQYVPEQRIILMHAGEKGGYLNDTWKFDTVSKTWTNLNPSNPPPTRAQLENGWAYDTINKKIFMFGGATIPGWPHVARSDTWTYDVPTNTWTNKAPATTPGARGQHAIAYDSTNGVFIMYGGTYSDGSYHWPHRNDTWLYDPSNNTWTQLSPSGQPPGLVHHNLQYDPINRRFIMWGGGLDDSGTKNLQQWVLTLTGGTAPLNITTTLLPNGQVGTSYSQQIATSGGTGTVTFSVSVGTLPAGLTLSPSGLLSGTPTTATTYNFSIQATAGTETDTQAYSVIILEATPPATPGMPSLQDEKDTYTRWGWTWNVSQEPNYPATSFSVVDPAIHDETEGDDLWTNLMQYQRTAQAGYLSRATAWARYFKDDYRQCIGTVGWTYCTDKTSWYFDHCYGEGLVAWAAAFSSAAHLTAAENIMIDIEAWYNTGVVNDPVSYYGPRGIARHLLIATKVAEATGLQRWITQRDEIINLFINSPDWDEARGMYWCSEFTTNGKTFSGTYAQGYRVQNSFMIGLLAEAFWQAYLATANQTLRTRLIQMANFVNVYGLDAEDEYASGWFTFNLNNNTVNHGTAPWSPAYTTDLVGILVMGYKLNGNQALLDRAKYFFNRGTKGAYSTGARLAGDTEVHHFIDTQFDSSTSNFYYAYNKGELRYCYLIFENGGLPSVEGGVDVTAPDPPTNLRRVP